MIKAITWCAKCLFLYLIVVILSVRFAWIFTLPAWSIATRFHWTNLARFPFLLNYFLPIFTAAGFIIGLIPFGRLTTAASSLFASPARPATTEPSTFFDTVSPVLWAWLPVTCAFLMRFITWQSTNTSVMDAHRSAGRLARFFGNLNVQTPALMDSKWATDRFIYTGPMLFLMALALAVYLRQHFTRKSETQPLPSDQ
jgi:hypothetical protein